MKSPCAKFQMFWLKNDVSDAVNAVNFFSLGCMGIFTLRHCDVKMTSYIKSFDEFEFRA